MDSPPSPKVSLPSIHEMFPEHLMTKNNERPPKRQMSPPSPTSSSSSSRFRQPPQRETTPSSHSSSHRDRSYSASSRSQHPTNPDGRAKEVVSFDVLRSDPASSSLQHLVSSTTLPSRAGNVGFHPNQVGVDRGTAPAFRVSVKPGSTPPPSDAPSPSSSSSSRPQQTYQQPQPSPPADSNPNYVKGDAATAPASSSPLHPAMISFPVSGSAPTAANPETLPDDPGTMSEDDDGTNDGPTSGKKHVCPTCLKRFNRPSSLRIHVNTHTGATPFRCPWPNCGREFNVNSNMRRHYRNHTTPGFSRQPNDNRRRRRRSDLSQPHPGELHPGGVPTLRRVAPDGFMHPHHPTAGYAGSDDSDGYESDYARRDSYEEDDYAYAASARPRSWNDGPPHILSQSMARVSVGSSRSPSTLSAPQPPPHDVYTQQQQHPRHSHPAALHPAYPRGHHGAPPPSHPPPPHPPPSHHPQYRSQYHHHQLSPRHHPYTLPHGRPYPPPPGVYHQEQQHSQKHHTGHSSESPSPSPSPPPPAQPRYQLSEALAAAAAAASHKESMMMNASGYNNGPGVYSHGHGHGHSMADSMRGVSTTLRPAFHSAGAARVSSERYGGPGYAHHGGPPPTRVSAGTW